MLATSFASLPRGNPDSSQSASDDAPQTWPSPLRQSRRARAWRRRRKVEPYLLLHGFGMLLLEMLRPHQCDWENCESAFAMARDLTLLINSLHCDHQLAHTAAHGGTRGAPLPCLRLPAALCLRPSEGVPSLWWVVERQLRWRDHDGHGRVGACRHPRGRRRPVALQHLR